MNKIRSIKNVRILSTGSYVPETIYTNEYLASIVNTDADWIYNTLGISERRIASKTQATSDLAFFAAKKAIENSGLSTMEIDLIIVATTTPDRLAPSTACILQNKLGAYNSAAFDINAVCSGFIYALTTGAQFISSGMYENILIVGADTFSRVVDWKRRDCVFFGDGAGAVVLTVSNVESFLVSKLFADGKGKNVWTIPAGGAEKPTSRETLDSGLHFFQMDGRAVFDTAVEVLPLAIKEVLEYSNVSLEEVKYIIPHQPSIGILKETAKRLGIDFSKILTNMKSYANTSAATIPLLLDETNQKGMLTRGDNIVFAAVGAGWTWGASLIKWQ